MSSQLIRLGLVAASGIVLAGAIAAAQDRKPIETAEAGGVAVFNPVEGRMVVVIARPDGSRVKPETSSANSIPPSCVIAWPARRSWSAAPRRKCMERGSPAKSR